MHDKIPSSYLPEVIPSSATNAVADARIESEPIWESPQQSQARVKAVAPTV